MKTNDILYKNYIVVVQVNDEVEKLLIDEVHHYDDHESIDSARYQEEHIAFFATSYDYSVSHRENMIYDETANMFVQAYLNNQTVIDQFNSVVYSNEKLLSDQDDMTIIIILECEKNDNEKLETLFVRKFANHSFDDSYKFCEEIAAICNVEKNRKFYDVCIRRDTALASRVRELRQQSHAKRQDLSLVE